MNSLARKDWNEIEVPEDNNVIKIFSKSLKFDDELFKSYQPGMQLISLECRLAWFLYLVMIDANKACYTSTLLKIIQAMEYYELTDTFAYKQVCALCSCESKSDTNYDVNFRDLLLLPYDHQLKLIQDIKNNNVVFYYAPIGKTTAVLGLLNNTNTILYVNNNPETCKYMAKMIYNMNIPFAVVNTSKPFLEMKRNNICGGNKLGIVISDYKRAIELLKIKDNDYMLYLDDFENCLSDPNLLHKLMSLLPEKTVIVGKYINDIKRYSKTIEVIDYDIRDIILVNHTYIEHIEHNGKKRKVKPPDFGKHKMLVITNNPFKKCNILFPNTCRYELLKKGICVYSKNDRDQEYCNLAKTKLHESHTIFTDLSDVGIRMPYDYIMIDRDIYKRHTYYSVKLIACALTTSLVTNIVMEYSEDTCVINNNIMTELYKQNCILQRTQEHPRHPYFNQMMSEKYELVSLSSL